MVAVIHPSPPKKGSGVGTYSVAAPSIPGHGSRGARKTDPLVITTPSKSPEASTTPDVETKPSGIGDPYAKGPDVLHLLHA